MVVFPLYSTYILLLLLLTSEGKLLLASTHIYWQEPPVTEEPFPVETFQTINILQTRQIPDI